MGRGLLSVCIRSTRHTSNGIFIRWYHCRIPHTVAKILGAYCVFSAGQRRKILNTADGAMTAQGTGNASETLIPIGLRLPPGVPLMVSTTISLDEVL